MVSDRTDDKLTDFGWLDFSAADMKRTRDALTAISSDSVDELGISIIRDGFAEQLFPGLSVIQTSLKYFLLIPAMLKKIELEGKITGLSNSEIRESLIFMQFKEELIKLECAFCDTACNNAADKTNIIGNSTANNKDIPLEKRLVRFPHDIYWHGLYVFGLIESPTMRDYVRSMIARHQKRDDKKTGPREYEKYWKHLFPFEPDEVLKSQDNPSPLQLTEWEQKFLIEKITNSIKVKGTLLEELIGNYSNFEMKQPGVTGIANSLKKSSLKCAKDAADFTLYMRCAFLGFNIAYFHNDENNGKEFYDEIDVIKKLVGGFDIGFLEKVADRFSYREKKPHVFANMKAYFELLNGEFTCENIRKAMIKWEIAAKRTKAYLEKSNPSTDGKWVGMKYLDFRLETALRLFENQGNK